jgi:hypothetical protein
MDAFPTIKDMLKAEYFKVYKVNGRVLNILQETLLKLPVRKRLKNYAKLVCNVDQFLIQNHLSEPLKD